MFRLYKPIEGLVSEFQVTPDQLRVSDMTYCFQTAGTDGWKWLELKSYGPPRIRTREPLGYKASA